MDLMWFKGEIVKPNDALVNVLTPSFQYGLNVFEGVRGYWNASHKNLYLFRLSDHIDRLLSSSKLMGINCPYGKDEIMQFTHDVVSENGYQLDISIRITLFVEGSDGWASSGPVSMFISPIKRDRTCLSSVKGISACISSWERISDRSMPPRIKAGANYVSGRYGMLEARRNGYDQPIFMNRNGFISEGAGACLFIISKNQLLTPPLSASILNSITRDTLFELADQKGLTLIERDIDRTELLLADEAFFCGTSAELTPIVSIDKMPLGSGNVGPITLSLLSQYLKQVTNATNSMTSWNYVIYS